MTEVKILHDTSEIKKKKVYEIITEFPELLIIIKCGELHNAHWSVKEDH